MSFKQAFERNVNRTMQADGQDPKSGDEDAGDAKKHHDAVEPEHEVEDKELSEKKDRPPRFSTLFVPGPTPASPRYAPPKRRSGVYIPMALFIVLAIALFLESILLFTYTIIGLYNNRPEGLFAGGGRYPAPINGCDCADQQSGINIAPNFYMQPQVAPTETVTIGSTSSSASRVSSINTSFLEADVASKVESMLSTLLTTPTTTKSSAPSVTIVTYTPPVPVTSSLKLETVNDEGSLLYPSTVTRFTTISPGRAPTPSPSSSNQSKATSLVSILSSDKSALSSKSTPTPSTLQTTTTPQTTTKVSTPTTTGAAASPTTSAGTGTGNVCFGGSGATELDCPGL